MSYILGKYFVGHERKLIMVVLPDITYSKHLFWHMNETKKIHQRKKDSKEYSRKFQGMFEKIPERAQEDSIECPRKFSGTSKEISRNFQKDSGEYRKNSEECY